MRVNLLACFALIGFLVACDNGDAVSKSRYSCPGNLWIEATFSGGKQVEIDIEGRKIILPRVESASGVRYETEDGQFFWSKGKDAQFVEKQGAAPISCQRR